MISNLIEQFSASKAQRLSNNQLPSMQGVLYKKPSEKIDSYPREKDCSLGIGEKIIILFTIIMTMILVTIKKQIPVII